MKKFICLLLVSLLAISLIGCKKEDNKVKDLTIVESPLLILNTVYDSNGNLLNQTLYNKETDEYVLQEYYYELINDKYVCIDQKSTIIKQRYKKDNTNELLNIVHNKDISKGPIDILNGENIKVKITECLGVGQWQLFGYRLKIENTSTKIYSITIDDTYILGIRCKPVFSITHVEPGHTAYFDVVWQIEELERNHVPYIDDVEFKIRVFFNEPYNYDRHAEAGNSVLIKTN